MPLVRVQRIIRGKGGEHAPIGFGISYIGQVGQALADDFYLSDGQRRGQLQNVGVPGHGVKVGEGGGRGRA